MKDAKSKTIAGEAAAGKLASLLTSARIGFMATPANDAGTEWSFQVLPGDGRALAKAHAAASEPDAVESASFTQSMAKLLPAFVPAGKGTKKRKEVGFAKLFGSPPNAILVQLIHDEPGEKGSCIRFSWQSSLPVLDVCSTTIVFKDNMEAKAIEKFDAITHAEASKVVARVELEQLESFGQIKDLAKSMKEGPEPYYGGCGITENG